MRLSCNPGGFVFATFNQIEDVAGYFDTTKLFMCPFHPGIGDFFSFGLVLNVPFCQFKKLLGCIKIPQVLPIPKEQIGIGNSFGQSKRAASQIISQSNRVIHPDVVVGIDTQADFGAAEGI